MKLSKTKRSVRAPKTRRRAAARGLRRKITGELPDLIASDRKRKEARDEPTLSGELRRAIHACPDSLAAIAADANIPVLALDEFLTGERTLRSDVIDRLVRTLRLELIPRG